MGALIKDGEEDKYRIRSNGGKIIVRLSEKVMKNHTINYPPKNIYNTHKLVYKHMY